MDRENSSDVIVIRRANESDADSVATVYIASRRAAAAYMPTVHTDAEIRAWVVGYMVPQTETWVAEAAGQIVALIVLAGDVVDELFVAPADQGAGVGGLLLAHAKKLRPARLRLYTFQSNAPARRFYEARGFVAKEFNDGSRNEEREPDVLYEWTP
jgi:GNAT superfamily N-acetyltransferase